MRRWLVAFVGSVTVSLRRSGMVVLGVGTQGTCNKFDREYRWLYVLLWQVQIEWDAPEALPPARQAVAFQTYGPYGWQQHLGYIDAATVVRTTTTDRAYTERRGGDT